MWRFNSPSAAAEALIGLRFKVADTWGMDNLLVVWANNKHPSDAPYMVLDDCTPSDTGDYCVEIADFLNQVAEFDETVEMRRLANNYWLEWTPAEYCREFVGLDVWWDQEND